MSITPEIITADSITAPQDLSETNSPEGKFENQDQQEPASSESALLSLEEFSFNLFNYLRSITENPELVLDRIFQAKDLELAACSGNPDLAWLISKELQKKVDLLMKREAEADSVTVFPDGEVRPVYNPETQLRGKHVVIIQSFAPSWKEGQSNINDQVVELILASEAANRASAAEITVVMPYMAYSRSDKKDMPKGTIAASALLKSYMAQGVDRFAAVDIHKDQIAGFAPIFDILYSSEVFLPLIKEKIDISKVVFISPDSGSSKMVEAYSNRILGHDEVGVIRKSRSANSAQSETKGYSGPDLSNKIVVFVDDLISSGSTAIDAAALIAKKGVLVDESGQPQIYFIAPHAQFIGDALSKFKDSAFKEVWTSNTIRQRPEVFDPEITGGKIVVYNLAPFLAEKIMNVHTGRPMGID